MTSSIHAAARAGSKKLAAAALSASLMVGGCTTTGSSGGAMGDLAVSGECLLGALGAAVLGAGLSGDGNRERNALISAAAAFVGCQFVKSYKAQQVKTQEEVETVYRKQHRTLPSQPTVTAFNTRISPNSMVRKQGALGVNSDLTVVPGRSGGPVNIEHEVAIIDKYGVEWFKGKRQPNSGEAGSFQTAFDVSVPKEMEAGKYKLVQNVYLNGQPSNSRLIQSKSFTVLASSGTDSVVVAGLD